MSIISNASAFVARIVLLEIVLVSVAYGADNGDAPFPYPTCSHVDTSAERLGATVTADVANPVTPAWTGDADDGAAFSELVRDENATLTVDIRNFSAADALAVWIDWNEDGDWSDAGERVLLAGFNGSSGNYSGGGLASGSNTFVVSVPTNAGPVSSKAPCRIRLWDNSAPGSISPANPVPSVNSDFGEVEDYLLPVTNPPLFQITSVTRDGEHIRITWTSRTGKTNALERTAGVDGNYSTNGFAAIFGVTNTVGSATNYLDVGAATNVPALYYRIRLVP